MADCVDEILKSQGEDGLTKEQVRELVAHVQGVMKDSPIGVREVLAEKLKQIRSGRAQELKQKIYDALKDNQKKNLFKGQEKSNWHRVMDGLVAGSKHSIAEGQLTPGRFKNGVEGEFNALILAHTADKPHLLTRLASGELNKEVFKDLFARGKKNGVRSESADARAISDMVGEVNDKIVDIYDREGIRIKKRAGYIMRQTHDAEKLLNAGPEEWMREISQHLDEAETFGSFAITKKKAVSELTPEERAEFLLAAYDDITQGKHRLAGENTIVDEVPSVVGKRSRNVQKQVSKARALHFKGGESFFEYNEKFGRKNLMESVLDQIEHASRTASLVHSFGSNPKAGFDSLVAWGQANLLGEDLVQFNKAAKRAEADFAVAEGIINAPAHGLTAKVLMSWKSLESMALMGNVLPRSFTDLATSAAALTDANGRNYWANLGRVTQEWWSNFKGLPFIKDTGREYQDLWARRTGLAFREIGGNYVNRLTSGDGGPGAIAKAEQLYFRATGIGRWADSIRGGAAKLAAHDLADMADRSWDQIPKRQQTNLKQFGIGEDEWAIVRQGVESFEDGIGGMGKVLTPEGIRAIDDSAFRSKKQKNDLAMNVAAYLTDIAHRSATEPGIRTRAIVTGGRPPDDMAGLIRRISFQFMSFPIEMTRQMGRRLAYNPEGKIVTGFKASAANALKYNMATVAQSAVAMTALAYVGDALIDLSQGKTPKDPSDPKVIRNMFIKSGAGALYADFLFGDFASRRGEALIPGVFGPMLGKFNTLGDMYTAAKNGDPVAHRIAREVLALMPGRNLVYTRLALDQLIMGDINERINPGWAGRMRSYARKNNQEFFIPPNTEGLPTAVMGR